ncbi:MAG: hypothetical protein ACJAYY_002166 [Paraglaciecola sp.]|jgi:hypothetical protein|uniref:hypothetical protein n=1 Tax=Polaribacter sp. TaxID=1920175 RepID=UPI003EEDDBD3
MGNPNDKIIKQSQKAFFHQIETLETKELLEIIKNYKLLLNQLDDYNSGLLNDLIDIAEKTIKRNLINSQISK